MSFFHSNTWSRILVRSLADKKPQGFSILPIGSYCAMCTKCEHWNLVSPNIQNALLCTHCEEELHMSLEAHFTCPAVLRSQFAAMKPFDIEQFLASQAYELSAEKNKDNEVVAIIGFMDIAVKRIPQCVVCRETYPLDYVPQEKHTCACGARTANFMSSSRQESSNNNGFWSSMSKLLSSTFCAPKGRARVAQSPEPLQNVLAVVAGGSLSCYSINHGSEKLNGYQHHERICHIDLEDSSFKLHEAEASIVGSGTGMRFAMSLGSKDVARMWHSVLVNRVQAIGRQKKTDIERAVALAVAASSFDAGLDAESDQHSSSGNSATALRLIPV